MTHSCRFPSQFLLIALLAGLPLFAQAQTTVFDETIQSAYIAFYGRPADPDGLEFWSEQLDAAGGDLFQIIDAFSTSDEFQSRYGDLGDVQLLDGMYMQLAAGDSPGCTQRCPQ